MMHTSEKFKSQFAERRYLAVLELTNAFHSSTSIPLARKITGRNALSLMEVSGNSDRNWVMANGD